MLKIELKPFVCSLAMANNVTMVTRAVNRRPIFLSMQPVVIGNGAKMEPVGHFYMYLFIAFWLVGWLVGWLVVVVAVLFCLYTAFLH